MNTMKMALSGFAMAILCSSGLAQAAQTPIAVNAQLASSGYQLKIDGWKAGSELLPAGGSRFATLLNASGEIVESKIVLNNDYDKSVMNGNGRNYEVIISFDKSLRAIGGVRGFVKQVQQITGTRVSAPTRTAPGYNIAVALINGSGKITVDTARARVSSR